MTNKKVKTLILMSTYQGEKFLAEQIESIRLQTHPNWILLIRDDGSTDATLSILKKYIEVDSRIQLVTDQLGNVKPAQSFSLLMHRALTTDCSYIFFADQDDYWLPEKLERQIELLQLMKNQYGTDTPLLVHSDLCVVNSRLEILHPSYLAFEKLTANKSQPLATLLVHNYVTGCTIGMNKTLLKLAAPIAKTALMHDWWCALTAAIHGKIGFIAEATVYYRQHGNNDIGSKGFYYKINQWGRFKKTLKKNQTQFHLRCLQAKSLLMLISHYHPHYPMIKHFSTLPTLNLSKRFLTVLHLRLQPEGLLRKIALFLALFDKNTPTPRSNSLI